MERYCIKKDGKDLGCRESYMKKHENIRFDRITLLRTALYYGEEIFPECRGDYKEKSIFPECRDRIRELVKISVEGENFGSETDMYQDIFISIVDADMVKMDAYLHIYYTLLYEKNRDNYIPLIPQGWTKEKREDIKKRRKECRRNMEQKMLPFKILEGDNIRSSDSGKKFYEETKIPDFVPNMVRLYYLSKEFRNLFAEIKKDDAGKYRYSEIHKIFQDEVIESPRKEEAWLLERLLGVNLAWSFYSFFSVVFKGKTFVEIEGCKDIIQKIIHALMCWKGLYSRTLLVENLKIIYEIRVKSIAINKGIKPEKELEYLYGSVIRGNMDILAQSYDYIENGFYSLRKEKVCKEDFFEDANKKSGEYIKKYFRDSKGYAFLKGVNLLFLDKFKSDDKTEDKGKKQEFNERLYAFIQKIIINEQRK